MRRAMTLAPRWPGAMRAASWRCAAGPEPALHADDGAQHRLASAHSPAPRRAAPASSPAPPAGLHCCGSCRSCRAGSRARRAPPGWTRRCAAGGTAAPSADCAAARAPLSELEVHGSRDALGMRRQRIAVGRELQRAETQHRHRRAFVAGAAVVFGRNRVAGAGRVRRRQIADAARRRQHRVRAIGVPHVAAEAPRAVRAAFDVARLEHLPCANSFHSFVPRGNSQASGADWRRCWCPAAARSSAAWRRRPTTAGTGAKTAVRRGCICRDPRRTAQCRAGAAAGRAHPRRAPGPAGRHTATSASFSKQLRNSRRMSFRRPGPPGCGSRSP